MPGGQLAAQDERVARRAEHGAGETRFEPGAAAQMDIFGAADLIQIARAQIVVFEHFDADPRIRHGAIVRNATFGSSSRVVNERSS